MRRKETYIHGEFLICLMYRVITKFETLMTTYYVEFCFPSFQLSTLNFKWYTKEFDKKERERTEWILHMWFYKSVSFSYITKKMGAIHGPRRIYQYNEDDFLFQLWILPHINMKTKSSCQQLNYLFTCKLLIRKNLLKQNLN